jgi:hypothetical protein
MATLWKQRKLDKGVATIYIYNIIIILMGSKKYL